MKSVSGNKLKPLHLHNGGLDGSVLYQTPERLIVFGDIVYEFDFEDLEYYHYEWIECHKLRHTNGG